MRTKSEISNCLVGIIVGCIAGGAIGLFVGWQVGLVSIVVLTFFGYTLGAIADQLETLNIQIRNQRMGK